MNKSLLACLALSCLYISANALDKVRSGLPPARQSEGQLTTATGHDAGDEDRTLAGGGRVEGVGLKRSNHAYSLLGHTRLAGKAWA